jgi:hypothetical protein
MERLPGMCARDLHDRLVDRFAPVSPQTEITVSGDGVRWRCSAKRGQKSCLVQFFDVRVPEFLTLFEQEGKEVAAGRTPSQAETIDAVWHWLDDTPLDALYGRFVFVDRQKRELVRIRDSVLKDFSDLRVAAPSELVYWGSAFYHLWFRSETRSAQLCFYNKNEFPEAAFHGDQFELFRFKGDDCSALGAVLKRWLCDNALLSAMRKESPWLNFVELADYSENGNPMEGEFIQSWDRIEQFYDSVHFPVKALALPFIAELRRAGYDRKLRAGQSLFTFAVSRSRRHGLRAEQPYITFDFGEGTMDVFSKIQEEERIPGIPIALSGRVEQVLGRLVNQPIT